MKTIKRYDLEIDDSGEASLFETPSGDWVSYYNYANLYKKYIRARATANKLKVKNEIRKK
jgi:hypothetical protein